MRFVLQIVLLSACVASVTAINCYICNSVKEPECENDYEKLLKTCPVKSFGGMKGVKPIGCRVIRQYVNDQYSMSRECAYTGEEVVGKSNKGSMGVSRVYSQCSESGCNSSSPISTFTAIFVAILTIYKYIA